MSTQTASMNNFIRVYILCTFSSCIHTDCCSWDKKEINEVSSFRHHMANNPLEQCQ